MCTVTVDVVLVLTYFLSSPELDLLKTEYRYSRTVSDKSRNADHYRQRVEMWLCAGLERGSATTRMRRLLRRAPVFIIKNG